MGVIDNLLKSSGGKSAQEMLLEMAVTKICENLPPDAIDNIRKIAETIAGFKAQLERIEVQNQRIINMCGEFIDGHQLVAIDAELNTIRERLSNGIGTGISQTDHAGEQSKA
jgi:hypothetical protein